MCSFSATCDTAITLNNMIIKESYSVRNLTEYFVEVRKEVGPLSFKVTQNLKYLNQGSQTRSPPDVIVRPASSSKIQIYG